MNDFFSFFWMCLAMLAKEGPAGFSIAFAIGLILAALCWWACSSFTKLWNVRFNMTATHHSLCGVAAVLTLVAVLLFAALRYTKDIGEAKIKLWQVMILVDTRWQNDTFRDLYEAVYALRDSDGRQLEDFTDFPHPDDNGKSVPANQDESRVEAGKVYANNAARHFDKTYPFLSKLIWARVGIPEEVITADVRRFFANPNREQQSYMVADAIALAGREIRSELARQVPRLVPMSRLVLAVLFVLAQAVPFGLVAWAAYRDLKAFRGGQNIKGSA